MKNLNVDLRTARLPSRWAGAAAAVVCIAALSLLVALVHAHRERGVVNSELEQLMHERSGREQALAVSTPPAAPPYAHSARDMLVEASSPWPPVLSALETVSVVGVTPVSVEVNPANREAVVDVEFVDYATLLKYVDQLNEGGGAPSWAVLRAQVGVSAQAGQKASATLRAALVP